MLLLATPIAIPEQEGIEDVTDAFAAAAAAETQDDTDAAFQQVGVAHRNKVINFMVENNYDLPSSTYLQQRVVKKAGTEMTSEAETLQTPHSHTEGHTGEEAAEAVEETGTGDKGAAARQPQPTQLRYVRATHL